jgi:ribosomal protein S7
MLRKEGSFLSNQGRFIMATRKNTKAPTSNSAPKAAPKSTAKATEAEAPEAPPETKPELSPIEKMGIERSEAEASLSETMAEIASLASSGDFAGMQKASQDAAALKTTIEALVAEIAETGFAEILETAVRSAFEKIDSKLVPSGSLRMGIVIEDGVLQGVRPIVKIASRRSGTRTTAQAALKVRDSRLPPLGVTITSLGGNDRGGVEFSFFADGSVNATGPCADGTVLNGTKFGSLNALARHVTGASVNAYVWAQLGSKGRVWDGSQVNRKGESVSD